CGAASIDDALDSRPASLEGVTDDEWAELVALGHRNDLARLFHAGFVNGQAFLRAPDALAGRVPRKVEWTGGRRPPGDEVVPADLRIDHVYLVSCKYLSKILHNPSPARLVDGLLSHRAVDDRGDWYERVAPAEHQALYDAIRDRIGVPGLPDRVAWLDTDTRRRLARALRGDWPDGALEAYQALCRAVSESTAERWRRSLSGAKPEEVLWRLLRIGAVPYFVLGVDRKGSMRMRISTPWDWRQRFRLRSFDVEAQQGGQPLVGWTAVVDDRAADVSRTICGHVEVRWSHGRFGQRPEAKVYLDTRHEDVPGYFPIDGIVG
ncbi:MAG TPA: hypothetical protein VFN21_06695, partial [Acidimicrobiales bacterium]|nr:hypothetical protein [Acidimicrobiales bacterium]